MGDTRITIDAKHNNKIHYFKELNESLPLKKKNLNILKKKLNIINQRILKELTNDEFNLKIKMEDEIELLKETILDIESNKEEKEYYKKTGSILFDYYDNSNKYDKKITNSINKKRNSKSVMDWFNKNNKIKSNTKKEVCDKYLSLTDPNFVRKINEMPPDFCKNCNIERKTHLSDGCLVCQKCGEVEYIVIDSDKPSYKDPPKEISYFAYKRINHFNEWLAQFQAKGTTEIPQELYELILKEIKKERIQDTRELSLLKVREILKKLKKNKYYEHVPH